MKFRRRAPTANYNACNLRPRRHLLFILSLILFSNPSSLLLCNCCSFLFFCFAPLLLFHFFTATHPPSSSSSHSPPSPPRPLHNEEACSEAGSGRRQGQAEGHECGYRTKWDRFTSGRHEGEDNDSDRNSGSNWCGAEAEEALGDGDNLSRTSERSRTGEERRGQEGRREQRGK